VSLRTNQPHIGSDGLLIRVWGGFVKGRTLSFFTKRPQSRVLVATGQVIAQYLASHRDYFAGKTVIFMCQHSIRLQQQLLKHIRVEKQHNIKGFSMSSTTTSTENDSPIVHLVIADVWNEGEEESIEVHILLKSDEDEDLVQTALAILAEEGYHEAELVEMGTITEEPEEEPHKSAWHTALTGEVALIEFDGDDEEE